MKARVIIMASKKGKIINDACEILKQTYKEIKSLFNEVEELLLEYNENLKFKEEWSKGGKYLKLRNNHFFIFQEENDIEANAMEENPIEFFVLVFIFHDGPNVSRTSLDEPEIWAGKGKTKNANVRYTGFRYIFSLPEEGFSKKLRANKKIFDYSWEDGEGYEFWEGKFIGYPLVEITNKNDIKEKLLDKLFDNTLEDN